MRIASLLCLLVPAAAFAAPPPPPGPPPPPSIFVSPIGEPFRLKGPGDDPVADWFASVDKDVNQALSEAEIRADAEAFFATLDLDHDGELDPDELSRYEREVAPEIQLGRELGRFGNRGRRGGEKRKRREADDGLQGAGRFSWLNIPEPVAAADADLNRGVSRAELVAAAVDRLRKLDADGDGSLTRAELPPLPSQRTEEEKKRARKKPKPAEGIPIPLD